MTFERLVTDFRRLSTPSSGLSLYIRFRSIAKNHAGGYPAEKRDAGRYT
jgi:hypothetical protein